MTESGQPKFSPVDTGISQAAMPPELLEARSNPESLYELPSDDFFEDIEPSPEERAQLKESFKLEMDKTAKREAHLPAGKVWGVDIHEADVPEIMGKIKERIESLKHYVLEIVRTGEIRYRDQLTGGLSMQGMERRFYAEKKKLDTLNKPDEVMLLVEFDIDSFKLINDKFGHPAGDGIIKAVVTKLKEKLRTVDAVGRRSGDEFSVILNQVKRENIEAVIKKITEAISEIDNPNGGQLNVTGGAKVIEKDSSNESVTYQTASKEADTAGIYQKIAEPGTVVIASPELRPDFSTEDKREQWASKTASRRVKREADKLYAGERTETDPRKREIIKAQIGWLENDVVDGYIKIELAEISKEHGDLED